MKQEYKYTEDLGNNKYKLHIITVNDGNKRGGWYRQITAMEGLINRATNRWYHHYYTAKNHPKFPNARIRFRRFEAMDMRMDKRLAEKYGIPFEEPETVHHDSVWDFMDSIGYDHKNKTVSNTDKFLIIGLTPTL